MADPAKTLTRAAERYADARAARDVAIREAHDGGMSYRKIGDLVGLSYSRVMQIVRGT